MGGVRAATNRNFRIVRPSKSSRSRKKNAPTILLGGGGRSTEVLRGMHALGSVSLCAALRLDLISIQGPRVITPAALPLSYPAKRRSLPAVAPLTGVVVTLSGRCLCSRHASEPL